MDGDEKNHDLKQRDMKTTGLDNISSKDVEQKS